MQTLRWLRVVGDTIFAVGAFALVYFVFGLSAGYSIERGEVWSRDAQQVPARGTAAARVACGVSACCASAGRRRPAAGRAGYGLL